MFEPEEIKEYPGFFKIPGYSTYGISLEGRVINTRSGYELKASRNPDGYFNFRIDSDHGNRKTWGRHRLLCYVFKHSEFTNDDLIVNHKNGIKGDDRLNNLEWLTYQENQHHAGEFGLTEKCLPVLVFEHDSNSVKEFPSLVDCGLHYSLSKDAIAYRVKFGKNRIFPERRQYQLKKNFIKWYTPDNLDEALLENGLNKRLFVRKLETNEELVFERISDFVKDSGIPFPTISSWLKRTDQPVLPGLIQLKLTNEPWREVKDMFLEQALFLGTRPVRITNDKTGEKKIFSSLKECASYTGLKVTALCYRVGTNGEKCFSDGFRYEYYSY